MTVMKFVIFGLTIGHIGGIGIVVSDEILHYQYKYSYIAGTLNLSKSMHCFSNIYMDTTKTWLRRRTQLPPSSTKQLYSFLPQSIIGGFLNSWQREKERLERKHKAGYGPANCMLWFSAAYILFSLAVCWGYGLKGLLGSGVLGSGSAGSDIILGALRTAAEGNSSRSI